MPAQNNRPLDRETRECVQELEKLISLLKIPANKQQLPCESQELGQSLQWPAPLPKGCSLKQQSKEAVALEQFSTTYQADRNFTNHPQKKYFGEIFILLLEQRIGSPEWANTAPPENIQRVLVCLRILMRDSEYQKEFSKLSGVKTLAEHLRKATDSYLTYGDGPFVVDILKEMTNIFQKLSSAVQQREYLVACGVHKSLVLLLSASDIVVLHCTMHALISLAQSPKPRSLIAELNSIEILLHILQEYDVLSKKLSANLLRFLCADSQAREMIKVYDGIPRLLSLLHGDNIKLLWSVVWCLVQLADDPDTSNDIRLTGGLPLLLSLLHDRKFVSDRSSSTTGPNNPSHGRMPSLTAEEDLWNGVPNETQCTKLAPPVKAEEMKEHQLSLKSACCACLTELVRNDTNAQHIVQANGVYSLCLLILPQEGVSDKYQKATETLQANAFRTLRWLFSMERNRRLFKKLFPPALFEKFIDIKHYVREMKSYMPLVQHINSLPEDTVNDIRENIESLNQNKAPSHFVGEYAVIEHIGSGAFGAVHKVKKGTAGQSFYAMKEIFTQSPTFGKNSKERDTSVGEIISELTIIKEQLKHPNIVRYYKTFVEQDKLFIVMELIEGAPLGEHFTSLKEKKEKFTEPRIWNIFIQMVLALRYLHKEKAIVHRDLTPNNIMLGENDKVTVTDFGLAKQKRKDCSKLTSVVGTIQYSCPEIVQNQPYGEKADVWALGCILYQMCTLYPPFFSNNMLSLATKIVEADYDPIPDNLYSDKVISTVRRCITADHQERPDIVEVASHIADIMLSHMDQLKHREISLEKKLDRERKRTQRNFVELNKNMQNYHRLFLASQERYDKLLNLGSSGGAQSMKDESDLGEVFCDQEPTVQSKLRSDSDSAPGGYESELPQPNGVSWYSDDDLGDSCGSSSESRESSAGASRFHRLEASDGTTLPRPPRDGTPKSRRKKPRYVDPNQALTVDIPAAAADRLRNNTMSRDSGYGDPSPSGSSPGSMSSSLSDGTKGKPPTGMTRSISMELMSRRGGTSKGRPTSATQATLSISPHKVRQISDPILQMLHQLHKILYITQLPPTLCPNPRRKVIEKFKRALFVQQSTSLNLKNELKKLLEGSRDLIDFNLGPSETPLLLRQASMEVEALEIQGNKNAITSQNYEHDAREVGLTYEQMQSIIESVLVESGYYNMSPHGRNRTLPLSPLTTSEPPTGRKAYSAT